MRRLIAITGFVTALVASQLAGATPVSLAVGTTGPHILGEVIPGVSGEDGGGQVARDLLMVNTVLAMDPGQQATTKHGQGFYQYYRSLADYPALNEVENAATSLDARCASNVATAACEGLAIYSLNERKIEVVLPLGTTYQYLVAAWDGKSGGAQVWYIGDIAAGTTLLIPRYARPDETTNHLFEPTPGTPKDNQYGITNWTLFNPTAVPDGGRTAVLLGLSLLVIGLIKWLRT